jgi:hypothetical protein
MPARQLHPLRVLPMLAVIIVACSCSDFSGPITLADLAGRYAVTQTTMQIQSHPSVQFITGPLDGIQVSIAATGDFTVATTAATGLRPQSGKFSIAGNVLTVTTDDTGSVFFYPIVETFTYRDGVLKLIQKDIPMLWGEDIQLTTETIELTKR